MCILRAWRACQQLSRRWAFEVVRNRTCFLSGVRTQPSATQAYIVLPFGSKLDSLDSSCGISRRVKMCNEWTCNDHMRCSKCMHDSNINRVHHLFLKSAHHSHCLEHRFKLISSPMSRSTLRRTPTSSSRCHVSTNSSARAEACTVIHTIIARTKFRDTIGVITTSWAGAAGTARATLKIRAEDLAC